MNYCLVVYVCFEWEIERVSHMYQLLKPLKYRFRERKHTDGRLGEYKAKHPYLKEICSKTVDC